MKILKQGSPPLPWWTGKKLKCNNCNTEFELESGDGYYIVKSSYDYALVRCPCCKCHCDLFKDTKTKSPNNDPLIKHFFEIKQLRKLLSRKKIPITEKIRLEERLGRLLYQ